MKYIFLILSIFLAGCTRNACQIAVDDLVKTNEDITKIPQRVYIELDQDMHKANAGGTRHLENISKLYPLVNSVKSNCSER